MKEIYIERGVGDGFSPYIIAEAGINHDGDINKALDLVDAAADCGADAIKFQTHLPDYEMLESAGTAVHLKDENLYQLLHRVSLSKNDHYRLQERSQERGITFLSTAYCKEAVDFLDEFKLPAYKVGSGELTHIPLLRHIARKGKPMIISTAASNYEHIRDALDSISKINDKIALMHCVFEYPADPKDCNINVIPIMKERYNIPVGFSDHSQGIYITIAALGLGANLIEKHFTIDRNWPGPDQLASVEPDELSEIVKAAKSVHLALGSKKELYKGETTAANLFRHSLVVTENVLAGQKLSEKNLGVRRPGTGILPKYYDSFLGKAAKKDIKEGTLLRLDDLV